MRWVRRVGIQRHLWSRGPSEDAANANGTGAPTVKIQHPGRPAQAQESTSYALPRLHLARSRHSEPNRAKNGLGSVGSGH